MRKSRFTEEQIIAALKEHDAGARVRDLSRKLGVTEHSFYRWRAKYGGMEVSDARKLKALEQNTGEPRRTPPSCGISPGGFRGERAARMQRRRVAARDVSISKRDGRRSAVAERPAPARG